MKKCYYRNDGFPIKVFFLWLSSMMAMVIRSLILRVELLLIWTKFCGPLKISYQAFIKSLCNSNLFNSNFS